MREVQHRKRDERPHSCRNDLMAESDHEVLLLASITSAFGLALGELLLAFGRSADLGRCLSDIHVAAQATILCSDRARATPRNSEQHHD